MAEIGISLNCGRTFQGKGNKKARNIESLQRSVTGDIVLKCSTKDKFIKEI